MNKKYTLDIIVIITSIFTLLVSILKGNLSMTMIWFVITILSEIEIMLLKYELERR